MATVLFVHAHPDDETLATGVSLAHLAARGHDVRVLTMTLGEEGEVIPEDLRHLAADRDDRLGPFRREELRGAMETLGVRHAVLGEDPEAGILSRYRDSGMAGTPSVTRPDAFANANVTDAAAMVLEHVADVRPDVVVTYDAEGGYRHPDHIQAHRVTCAAVATLAETEQPALYAVQTPRSWAREDRAWLAGHPVPREQGWRVLGADEPFPASVVPDLIVTRAVVDADAIPRQAAALRHHRTQVTVVDGCYALSNGIAARLSGREGFVRLDPTIGHPAPAGPDDAAGRGAQAGRQRHTPLVQDEP